MELTHLLSPHFGNSAVARDPYIKETLSTDKTLRLMFPFKRTLEKNTAEKHYLQTPAPFWKNPA